MQVLETSTHGAFAVAIYTLLVRALILNGLGNLIPDDPTTGSIGGISRGTANSGARLRTSSRHVWMRVTSRKRSTTSSWTCTLKGESPTVMICGRNIYRLYRQAAKDRVMFALNETKTGQKMSRSRLQGLLAQRRATHL